VRADESFPVGSLQVVTTDVGDVVLGRDDRGFYALQGYCTHQFFFLTTQPLSARPSALYCIRHGSTFGTNGEVLGGPAPTPLAHYPVDIDADGTIKVCIETTVPVSTRTPPP
jgi:Rieske Fe-S protein